MSKFRIITGDCRDVMTRLGMYFNLVFADPPFNIGHPYIGYTDKISRVEFDAFTEEWVTDAWAVTADRGIMCLHGPDDLCEAYLGIAARHGFRDHRIAWVNWHYRFGQYNRANWVNAREHLLVFAKDKRNYTWNVEDVVVPSDRALSGDKRINDTPNGGTRPPGTVWGVPSDGMYWGRVQGNNEERNPVSPNQLPEVYLARIIKAYSNPGDHVLDPFCGGGGTVTVATALGRHCTTIDISEDVVAAAKLRVMRGPVRDVRKSIHV